MRLLLLVVVLFLVPIHPSALAQVLPEVIETALLVVLAGETGWGLKIPEILYMLPVFRLELLMLI